MWRYESFRWILLFLWCLKISSIIFVGTVILSFLNLYKCYESIIEVVWKWSLSIPDLGTLNHSCSSQMFPLYHGSTPHTQDPSPTDPSLSLLFPNYSLKHISWIILRNIRHYYDFLFDDNNNVSIWGLQLSSYHSNCCSDSPCGLLLLRFLFNVPTSPWFWYVGFL